MIRKLFLLSLFFFISACTPLVTGTPPPTPEMIEIAYPPSLSNWANNLHSCASLTPEIALTILETSPSDSEFAEADLTLSFGEPPQGVRGYAASLGEDEIVVIAGENVNLKQLSFEQLREIYSNPELYQAWTYGAGNELRLIFDRAVLDAVALSPETFLAPHPTAMLEAITKNPMAIGYLPKSWLDGKVHEISLEEDLQAAFKQPILVLTGTEPQSPLRVFLACLQNDQP